MAEENIKIKVPGSRRVWSNAETKAFLTCYAARKREFDHPRRKKFAMQNVLEDLISQNVLLQPTSVECLQIKMKNLQRAYKAGKDGNNLTGGSPIVVPFEEEMDSIFGSQPNISNCHTLNLRGDPIVPLAANSVALLPIQSASESSLLRQPSSPSLNATSPTSCLSPESPSPTPSINCNPTPSTPLLSSQSPSSSLPQRPRNKRLSKNELYAAKHNYLKRKEEILQKYAEQAEKAKEERFKQFMAAKERHHQEKMNILKELMNKGGFREPKE